MVARRHPAGRRHRIARRDPGRRRPPPRHRPQGRGRRRHAAAIGLPIHRSARVHAQRLGVHVRQDRPPLAGRRRHGRGVAPDRRPCSRTASPAWSPDGRRIAFTSNRRRERRSGLGRLDIHVVDVETRAVTAVTRGPRSMFFAPTWLPDGATIAALGHRMEGGAGSRNDIWLFAADGSDATPTGGRNLSATHDLMPGSGMSSDLTRGEGAAADPVEGRPLARLHRPDRRRLRAVADRRRRRPARTADRTAATTSRAGTGSRTGPAASRVRRIVYLRSTPTAPPDLWLLEVQGGSSPSKPRRLTRFNAEVLDELGVHQPVERHVTVDGRDIQGWLDPRRRRPAAARRPDPRRPAHALRLVAVVGVPAPRGGRDQRLLLQPARFRGLRRGVQRRQPPRLGTRSEPRRPGRRRCPRGRRPGRPRAPWSHRWLVRRLPDQLDRRPRSALPRGDDLSFGQRHGRPVHDRRHRRR